MGEQHDFLDRVMAVARRHGVDPGQVREVAGGVANRGFVLGEELFLRVSRPGYEDDLLKETRVVPAARFVGVLTPAIVEYDASGRLVDSPYAVMERVHGTEPADVPTGLAEQLARLHRLKRDPAPNGARPSDHAPGGEPQHATEAAGEDQSTAEASGTDRSTVEGRGAQRAGEGCGGDWGAVEVWGVPEDGWGDPWGTVDGLATRGYVDVGTAEWLTGWFTRLAERIDRGEPKVLIHGDVAAHNLLAGPGNELRALIDWGDAAWAPRAMEFAKLPLLQVTGLVPEYVGHAGSRESEEQLCAAVLWFHLAWAVGKVTADPWPGQRHWTAPPASRLLSILHFFTTDPPAPWSDLT